MNNSTNKTHVWMGDAFDFKGGIQVFNQFFLKGLAQQFPDHPFHIFLKSDRKQGVFLLNKKFQFIFFGRFPASVRTLFWGVGLFFYAALQRPTLIICAHVNFSPIAALINKIFRIPYVVITHGVDAWGIKEKAKLNGLTQAEKILAVSEYTRCELIRQIGEPHRQNIAVFHNTFNEENFTPKPIRKDLLDRYGIQKKKILLSVGRLLKADRYKGYDSVLKSLESLRRIFPDIHYLIVGTGDDQARLQQLAVELDVVSCVTFAGFVADEELSDHYNLCDIFVMPSTGEGFGIVFLEAMACGKPVIAGNSDGSVEPLRNGELGVLIDPKDQGGLERAITQILNKTHPLSILRNPHLLSQRTRQYFGNLCFQKKIKQELGAILRERACSIDSPQVLNIIDSMDPKTGGMASFLMGVARRMKQVSGVGFKIFSFDSFYIKENHQPGMRRAFKRNFIFLRTLFTCWPPKVLLDLYAESCEARIIHQHGVWSFGSMCAVKAAKRSGVPLVCSVHGMLEPWALKKSWFKKRVALFVFQKKFLKAVSLFHATCNEEADSIRKLGLHQPIAVIPLGVDLPDMKYPESVDALKQSLVIPSKKIVLFLSRVHPKKGLEMLLSAWGKTYKTHEDWHLIIAGDGEINYLNDLKKRTELFSESVSWVGFVQEDRKDVLLKLAHLFILPSYSENFACVIPEAMAYGLPVISTKSTPWRDIESYDCGWWIDPNAEAVYQALNQALGLSVDQLKEKGLRGKQLVIKKYTLSENVKKIADTYRWLLNPDLTRPDYVRIT